MQPCLFTESLVERQQGLAAPDTCPDGRPPAQGCGAGPDQAWGPVLASSDPPQHRLQRNYGIWVPPVTGVWPPDGEMRGDVSTKLFLEGGEQEGESGHLWSLEGCQGPDLERGQRAR